MVRILCVHWNFQISPSPCLVQAGDLKKRKAFIEALLENHHCLGIAHASMTLLSAQVIIDILTHKRRKVKKTADILGSSENNVYLCIHK